MANPHSLVDFIAAVAPAQEGDGVAAARALGTTPSLSTVRFHAGRSALIDRSHPRGEAWSRVLDSLQRSDAPAYVEVDPGSGLVTQLLVPMVLQVGDIRPDRDGDGVVVELVISHAVHHLRKNQPDYAELLARLEAARADGSRVVVTETPVGHDIFDVRLLRDGPAAADATSDVLVAPTARGSGTDASSAARASPAEADAPMALSVVTLAEARRLFDLMNARVCCPAEAAPPCIPFVYPDDGCWGRAHEMCRLMQGEGAQPDKVWIYGQLQVATANSPAGKVHWGYHVAPTLQVGSGGASQTYVIDPSLFSGPVARSTWAGVQGDPGATLIASAASVFYRDRSGSTVLTDPTYAQTNTVLETYRNQLRVRAAGVDGPPPYLQWLPARPGVQFYGTVDAGATHSWFTWGWPAQWHVLWTVVPLTACPGAPQLTWRTRVERADAGHATYWIAVTNVGHSAVRIEGRYDVLSR